MANKAYARSIQPQVDVLQASEIECRPIDWLWPGWLAAGKLHLLAGAPGTGKTTIALALAASISAGETFPDSARAKVGNVLIWSGEDDPADTLVPRLFLAGADLSRIFFVGDVRDGQIKRSFDPATDLPKLQQRATEIGGISMVVLDPVVSAVAGDSHKNSEVRRGLQPVVDFAHSSGAAVLGISHFSKGTVGRDPLERVTGSIAFGALARVVMVTTRRAEPGTGHDRIFARAKSNIGQDGDGFEYSVQQAIDGGVENSLVLWGLPLKGSARELIEHAEGNAQPRPSMLHDAESWLLRELETGARAAQEVTLRAQEAGITSRTLHRAKQNLQIRSMKNGQAGGTWWWSLPTDGKVANNPTC